MNQQGDDQPKNNPGYETASGMGIGIALGTAIGAAMGNIALGVAFGIIIGGIGVALRRRKQP